MARWLLPRVVLAALFLAGAIFAFFESIYLRDQFAEFAAGPMMGHARKIAGWMWAFRTIAALLLISLAAIFAG